MVNCRDGELWLSLHSLVVYWFSDTHVRDNRLDNDCVVCEFDLYGNFHGQFSFHSVCGEDSGNVALRGNGSGCRQWKQFVVHHGDGTRDISFHELDVFRWSNASFSLERRNNSDGDGALDLYRDLYGRFGLRGDCGGHSDQGNGRSC